MRRYNHGHKKNAVVHTRTYQLPLWSKGKKSVAFLVKIRDALVKGRLWSLSSKLLLCTLEAALKTSLLFCFVEQGMSKDDMVHGYRLPGIKWVSQTMTSICLVQNKKEQNKERERELEEQEQKKRVSFRNKRARAKNRMGVQAVDFAWQKGRTSIS